MSIKTNSFFTKNAILLLAVILLPVLSALYFFQASSPASEQDSQYIFSQIYPCVEKALNAGNPSDVKDTLDGIRSKYSVKSIRIISNEGGILSSSGPAEPAAISAKAEQLAASLNGQGFHQVFSHKGPSVAAYPIHGTDGRTLGIISMTFEPAGAGFFSGRDRRLFIPAVSAAIILAFLLFFTYMPTTKRSVAVNTEPATHGKCGEETGETGILAVSRLLPVRKILFPKKTNFIPDYLARKFTLIRNMKKDNWSCRIEPGRPAGREIAAGLRQPAFDGGKVPIDIIREGLDKKNLSLVKTLQRLSAVHKVALTTNSTMELDKVFYNLLEVTMKALNAETGHILLYDGRRKTFQVHTFLDHSGNSLKKSEIPPSAGSVSTWVYNSRKPVLIRDMEETPQFSRRSALGHEKKSLVCVPLITRDEIIGTMSVINKVDNSMYTPEDLELLTTIASQASFAMKNARLYEEQQKMYMNIIHALVSIIDTNDSYTRGHSERVTVYSMELARKVGLPKERLDIVERAAMLHDIGKIGVNAALLNKEKSLSNREILKMRQHPLTGMKILEPLDFLGDVSMCVGQHHERFDGMGYPFGIRGDKLLLESRILAIADAFDAMTSDRPYRKALSPEKAMREIIENAGRQHDPVLVRHFVDLVKKGTFEKLVSLPPDSSASFEEIPGLRYIYGIQT